MKHEIDEDHASDPSWQAVSPLLDEAVAKLKREDRDAVVLRYFQGKSVPDIAAALNVSPAAAQKRIARAVDRLRTFFAARGVNTSADALGLMLASQAVAHAPAALAATLACASASSSAFAGKGALTLMAIAKTKIAVASAAAVMLLGVTGTIAYQHFAGPATKIRQVRVDPATVIVTKPIAATLAPPMPVEQWLPKFKERYALKPGEIVKFIPAPWIPERTGFYRQESGESQYQSIPRGPDIMLITDDGTTLDQQGATFGGTPDAQYGAQYVLGIQSWDLRGAAKLLRIPMRGDWVVRADSTRDQRMEQFVALVSSAAKTTAKLDYQEIPREAVVVRGKLAFHPLVPAKNNRTPVIFYRGTLDLKKEYYAGGTMSDRIASMCDMPVVDEAGLPEDKIEVHTARIAYIAESVKGAQREAMIDELLANLAKQTSLEFKRETRTLPVWTLVAP